MLIAMSPDAYVTAISMGRSLALFNTENGNLEEFLEDVHGGIKTLNVSLYLQMIYENEKIWLFL